jgi:hypothetical protein
MGARLQTLAVFSLKDGQVVLFWLDSATIDAQQVAMS